VVLLYNENDEKLFENPVMAVLRTGEIVMGENQTTMIAKNGIKRIIAESAAPIRDKNSEIIGVVLVIRDITYHQKLEEQLLRAQKLESIGILAGGIAHDFNNILSAILGNISLAKLDLDPKQEIFEILSEAEKASLQAKNLTQQLLTFSKGGAPILQTMSISEIIRESTGFALRGSNARCDFSLPADLWSVDIDQGQISQVIHNLILNAQQSMPTGGLIWVSGENVVIEPEKNNSKHDFDPSGLILSSGKYVKIIIKDSGFGIPKENLKMIFDPYFSTKQQGSGLGLAITYSIVKKHDGFITVDSEMGVGSTFTLYLPASKKEMPPVKENEIRPAEGKGKILIMDDEAIIFKVASRFLSRLGYMVEYAKDGTEAIEMYQSAMKSGSSFAAIIMDLTVPGGMGGKEAIEKIIQLDPQVKAIVSSGYSNDPIMANYADFGFKGVVEKPYKMNDLSNTLSQIIQQSSSTEQKHEPTSRIGK